MKYVLIALLSLPVFLASRLHAAQGVLPDEMTLKLGVVANVGTNVVVVLKKRSIRSDQYLFGKWGPDGFKKMEPFPVTTYRGYVQGDPAMRVNANIEPGGIFNANFSDGQLIVATLWDHKIEVPAAGGTPLMSAGNKVVPLQRTREPRTPGGYLVPPQPMRRIQFIADIFKEYVDEIGGSVETAVSQIEQRFNDGDFVYARDVGVAWELAAVVVREEGCPGVDARQLADVEAGRYFNLIVLCPGKTGRPRSWGGPIFKSHDPLAGTAPLSIARVNVRNASGLVHEPGHKFRAAHNLDQADAMQGARARLGTSNIQLMLQHCEGRPENIFPAVVYNGPLPPFAMDDFANTTRDTPTTIDVLDNDYDGNGDTVSLQSVVLNSEKGGVAELSKDGRKVLYTPPPGFVGIDRFTYTVVDATGIANRRGRVKVDVRIDGLAAHLPLDNMEDGKHPVQGPYASQGQVHGLQTSFHNGVLGNALFNATLGSRGYVVFPDIGDPGRESLSVSLWALYPDVNSLTAGGGVLACKGACFGWGVGGHFTLTGWGIGRAGGGKGFVFAGNSVRNMPGEYFELRSVDQIETNAWYHLVMVLDREEKKVRAWINNREVLTPDQRTHIPDGVIDSYMGLALFNGFNWKAGRACSALIDDVRIYTSALKPEQVAELYAEGKDAKAPDLKLGKDD